MNWTGITGRAALLGVLLSFLLSVPSASAAPLEWNSNRSYSTLTGYADVNFEDAQKKHSTFTMGHFNPIFNFLYNDLVFSEAEVEFELASDGSTETKLEYASIFVLAHDYLAIGAGKFLSPVGQFIQNVHPSWINKGTSKPVGFDDDQAAPEAFIGLQIRGGMPVLERSHVNYAFFVANGPQAEVEGSTITKIKTGGFNEDTDGNKVYGGRIGFLPTPKLEIGVSGILGKLGLFDTNGTMLENSRRYHTLGGDIAYQWHHCDLRGEYIQQRAKTRLDSAYSGGKWSAWYVQAAHRFAATGWEAVLRYGRFDSSVASQEQKQWAPGVNYWFGPSVVVKVTYEFNRGMKNETTDDNKFHAQLAYGF